MTFRDFLYAIAVLVIAVGVVMGLKNGLETGTFVLGVVHGAGTFAICTIIGVAIAWAADWIGGRK